MHLNVIRFMIRILENIKFQMQPEAAILIAKSGISNHAASDIPDDLCFSKFGTFHKVCS